MSVKTVYFIVPEPPLIREEVQAAFSKLHPSDPLARALRQIVQERVAMAVSDCTSEKFTERAAGHAAGRLAELLELQGELKDLIGPKVA